MYISSKKHTCVFVKRYDEGDFLILLLIVDDMLIVRQDTRKIASLKKALRKSFAMKDLVSRFELLTRPCYNLSVMC